MCYYHQVKKTTTQSITGRKIEGKITSEFLHGCLKPTKKNKFLGSQAQKHSSLRHRGNIYINQLNFEVDFTKLPIHFGQVQRCWFVNEKRRAGDQDCYQFLFKKQYLYRNFLCNNNKILLAGPTTFLSTCTFTMCPFNDTNKNVICFQYQNIF